MKIQIMVYEWGVCDSQGVPGGSLGRAGTGVSSTSSGYCWDPETPDCDIQPEGPVST